MVRFVCRGCNCNGLEENLGVFITEADDTTVLFPDESQILEADHGQGIAFYRIENMDSMSPVLEFTLPPEAPMEVCRHGLYLLDTIEFPYFDLHELSTHKMLKSVHHLTKTRVTVND